MNIIDINNLTFKYNKVIFNNLSLKIKENTFTTIIGNSCGKTTLANIICGNLEYTGNIIIDNIEVNKENKKKLNKKIVLLPLESDFINETVLEELNNFKDSQLFDINELLDKNISNLSMGEKQLIAFLKVLVLNPKIIIIDNAFCMINTILKKKIYKYLKTLQKDKNITIINITSDVEDMLLSDDIIILNNGKIVINGNLEEILKHERELIKLGYNIPFVCSLSNKIKYYNLVDHTYYDMDRLVDDLWK